MLLFAGRLIFASLALLPWACAGASGVIARTLWQISDTHMSSEYREGSPAVCMEQECCHLGSIAREGFEDQRAGPYGEFQCHLPKKTIESTLDFMNSEQFLDTDVVLWTMDSAGSQIFKQGKDLTLSDIRTEVELFKQRMPNKKIYPCLGNHDYHPITQWEAPPACDWVLSTVSELWSEWLPPDAISTVKLGGYYTVLIDAALRLVTLNTNFFDFLDRHSDRTDEYWDPAGQIAWFADVLNQAAQSKEKVLVFSHHFLGVEMENDGPVTIASYRTRFTDLMNKYSDVIIGHFAGHLHRDDFRIPEYPNPKWMSYVSPSVTPLYRVYPSVRQYVLDPQSYEILDYNQFFFNHTRANEENKVTWQKLYSARAEYQLRDLSPASWAGLITRMQADCSLFQRHWSLYYVNSHAANECDCDKCRDAALCSKHTTTWDAWEMCKSPPPTPVPTPARGDVTTPAAA